MKTRFTFVYVLLALLWLGGTADAAQRARRAGKAEEKGPVTVTRSATLQVPISSDQVTVFSYLSEPDKLVQWFPDKAIIEPQLGGKYHFLWEQQKEPWSGVITDYIKGSTLEYTWKPPGEENETRVRFKLVSQGAQTIVDLTHSGFTSSEQLDRAVKAWVLYLQNLKSVIEEGVDQRQQERRAPARTAPRRKH